MNTTIASTKLALLAREIREASGGFNALHSEPIAIVGMACRFPGGASSLDRFWSLLHNGVDAIREVPAERWDVKDYYHPDATVSGKMISRHGGFLDRIDCFDAEFFGISPREANRVDPQQRIFLEVAWDALHDAGLIPKNLSGSPTGVYLAIYYNDYARMQLGEPASIDAYTLSGTAHSLSVGRLSYLLNLRGPSMVVDTACSSSLVAVHLACQSLRTGESNMTLAGGVSAIIRPEENIPLSKWGLVAADGRCKTFDSRADGFIRGEGCGVIVLKRLADAIGDGDRIHAVIRGTAVNQDGRSTFMTAPNGLSQQAVIREALENARVEPDRISYVEAHGTGTKLGDPIEVEALAEVVGKPRPDGRSCAIGSVKTNIGHLEAASGIAGLIKVVLSLQHERIPPHLHFRELNPMIDLRNSALVIHPQGAPWPAGPQTRFAGVSSFGFGGTNAHVVIEEAPRLPIPEAAPAGAPEEKYLLPVSAKTWDGLHELAESYREFLGPQGAGRALGLADICFTAATRRDHMECRAVFTGRSHAEMIAEIDRFLASREKNLAAGRSTRKAASGNASADAGVTATDGSLETLGALYRDGREIKWETAYPRSGRVVALPGYPWRRQRYWIEEPDRPQSDLAPPAPGAPGHPLLGRQIHTPFFDGMAFESLIDAARPSFVAQHRIFGKPVLPAAAFIETVLCAAGEFGRKLNSDPDADGEETAIAIEDFAIHEPLLLDEEIPLRLQTGLTPEGGAALFRVFSQSVGEGKDPASGWRQHVSGRVRFKAVRDLDSKLREAWIELDKGRQAYPHHCGPDDFYQTLAGAGIEFGPSFQALDSIQRDGLAALGRIRVTDQVFREADDYRFHPAWLDACLQVFGAMFAHAAGKAEACRLFIPTVIESFLFLRRPLLGKLWSRVQLRTDPAGSSQRLIGDARIFDESGQAVALIGGVNLVAVQAEKLLRHAAAGTPQKRNWLYQIQWRAMPRGEGVDEASTPAGSTPKWLILADRSGIAAGLRRRLIAEGAEVVEFDGPNQTPYSSAGREIAEDACGDLDRCVFRLAHDHPGARWEVVYLQGLDAPDPAADGADSPLAAQKRSCGGLLQLAQSLPASGTTAFRLWVVTRGAMAANGAENVDPHQAPLWGLGSVLSLERPDLACVRIDLDPAGRIESDIEAVYREIRSGAAGENRVAFRDGLRCVARLTELPPVVRPAAPPTFSPPLELRAADSGLIEELAFHAVRRRPPGRGEIEIEVKAVGLNFRDVLNALKMLPGMETPLGGECSGRVVAVGEAVEGFHAGDEVMAFAIGSFRSFATIPAPCACRKPETLTFEEAASIPVVFLTAHYGLIRLAGLSAGEKVLIHAAAGGVGLAAVQIAQRAGAEIFATAGNDEKRRYLRSLGVPHVMDSRSTAFADEIAEMTGGQGVDVVLNSLAGEMIPKSLSLLREGGRFLEIGKRGIWDEAQVARFKSGISYWPFDLGAISLADSELFGKMLSEVMDEFRAGRLKPVPLTVFDANGAADAFQTMARAKHIGKIVISLAGADADAKHETSAAPAIRSDGTYLITGGLGALGLEVARWLRRRGARHIALLGRRGPNEKAAGMLETMRKQGARVSVLSADLSRRPQLDRVLGEIRREMPPLCGIVHAAGVIDDGLLQNQNWDRFVNVMAPKIEGAWNLHRATADMPLDFFIMFSSLASILGWQGQGAYAAGNAFLDALAHHRRRKGLTALSINWGPWAETGMAAGLESAQKRRMEAKGLQPIGSADALRAFQQMLTAEAPQIAAMKIDWPKFREEQADGAGRRFFSEVAAWRAVTRPPQSVPEKDGGFLGKLNRVPAGERRDLLADQIELQAAGVLGIARGKRIDRHQALHEIGLDSLMAVEMRNAICRLLGRQLPPTLLFDYPSIEALVDYLSDTVIKLEAADGASPQSPPSEDVSGEDVAYLQRLSDADAEALLMEELNRLPKDR